MFDTYEERNCDGNQRLAYQARDTTFLLLLSLLFLTATTTLLALGHCTSVLNAGTVEHGIDAFPTIDASLPSRASEKIVCVVSGGYQPRAPSREHHQLLLGFLVSVFTHLASPCELCLVFGLVVVRSPPQFIYSTALDYKKYRYEKGQRTIEINKSIVSRFKLSNFPFHIASPCC